MRHSPPGAPPPSASSRGARTRAPQEQTLPPIVGTCRDDWCRAVAVVKGARVSAAPQERLPHPHPLAARAHARHRSRRCRPSSAHVATTGAVPCRRRERRSCFGRPPGAPPPSASSRGSRTRAPQEQTLPPIVGTCGDDWCRAAAVATGAHVAPACRITRCQAAALAGTVASEAPIVGDDMACPGLDRWPFPC